MFDDLKPQSNQGQTDPATSAPASTPAPATPPQPAVPAGGGEPEDIFAGTDKAEEAPKTSQVNVGKERPTQFQPKAEANNAQAVAPPATPQTQNPNQPTTPPAQGVQPAVVPKAKVSLVNRLKGLLASVGQNKRYFVIGAIVITVLVVILFSMIALAYYKANSNKETPTPVVKQQPVVQEEPEVEETIEEEPETSDNSDTNSDNQGSKSLEDTIWFPEDGRSGLTSENQDVIEEEYQPTEEDFDILLEIMDSDDDGLTDAEEKRLKTNPYNKDTDNDGLFDREEVRIYKTNPNKYDTDEDGFSDGSEVQNGYNPKGSGKLYEL